MVQTLLLVLLIFKEKKIQWNKNYQIQTAP